MEETIYLLNLLKDFKIKCSNDIIEIKINNDDYKCMYIENIRDLSWWLIPDLEFNENSIIIHLK